MKKIGVLGAGTWGIALARMLALSQYDVTVWSALEQEVETYSKTRQHPNLPDMKIPSEIVFTNDLETACRDKDILLFAVPSVFTQFFFGHERQKRQVERLVFFYPIRRIGM